jgi:cytochrome c-type biogenesis protein CcmH/NrfG
MGTQMKYNIINLFLLLFLTGCNINNVVQEEPADTENVELSDIAKLEQQAQEAYMKKDWEAAEVAYQKLVENLPQESESWFRLGNIYARTNRSDAAVYAYNRSLNGNSNNIKAWNNLGITHLRQATNSFINMQQHMTHDDPLNDRVNHLIKSMTDLMETSFTSSEQTLTNQ